MENNHGYHLAESTRGIVFIFLMENIIKCQVQLFNTYFILKLLSKWCTRILLGCTWKATSVLYLDPIFLNLSVKTHKTAKHNQKTCLQAKIYEKGPFINLFSTSYLHIVNQISTFHLRWINVEFWNNVTFLTLPQLSYATLFQCWFNVDVWRWNNVVSMLKCPLGCYM